MRRVYRLSIHTCGLRWWSVDDDPAPLLQYNRIHRRPDNGKVCRDSAPFQELHTFIAEEQGPGIAERQVV